MFASLFAWVQTVLTVQTVQVAYLGFPGSSDSQESICRAGDSGSISGLERSPEEGNGNLLQNSCLEYPMGRGAWQATVHGVAELDTTEQLILLTP